MAHKDWLQVTQAAGCPAPMTRAALLALRATASLSKDCDYVITDHVQGRLLAGTLIHLQAVDGTTLATHAQVKTTFDNVAWEGRYDIDAALVYELRDPRNNTVIGAGAVAAFDWGNAAISDCRVEHSTWNMTIGAAQVRQRVRVLDGATLDTTGAVGGSLSNFEVSKGSTATLTNANLPVAHVTVTGGSALTAAGYVAGGTGLLRSDIEGGSTLTLGAGAGVALVSNTSLDDGAAVSHTGSGSLSLTGCRIASSAALTHSGAGALTASGCVVDGLSSSVTHSDGGSLVLTGTRVGPYGRVLKNGTSTGSMTLNYSVIDTVGYVQQLGDGNIVANGLRVSSSSYVTTQAGSAVPTLTINYSTLTDSAYVTATPTATAGAMAIQYLTVSSNGYVSKSGTGALTINSTQLAGGGRIQLDGVRDLLVGLCFIANVGRCVSAAAAGAGVTDSIQYSSMTDYGVVQFNASGAAANTVLYSSVRGNTGNITFSGTNTGTAVSRMTVDNGNVAFASNTAAFPIIIDIGVRDQGTVTISGCSAAQDMRYSTVNSYARWNMTNRTVAAQNYGADLRSNGTLTQTGVAGNMLNVSVAASGTIAHNGGILTRAVKEMTGTLTTGAFNHTDIQHRVATNKVLTAANNARADYQGFAAQLI